MFGALKEKLKNALNIFAKKVDTEAKDEVIQEEVSVPVVVAKPVEVKQDNVVDTVDRKLVDIDEVTTDVNITVDEDTQFETNTTSQTDAKSKLKQKSVSKQKLDSPKVEKPKVQKKSISKSPQLDSQTPHAQASTSVVELKEDEDSKNITRDLVSQSVTQSQDYMTDVLDSDTTADLEIQQTYPKTTETITVDIPAAVKETVSQLPEVTESQDAREHVVVTEKQEPKEEKRGSFSNLFGLGKKEKPSVEPSIESQL
jgi:hypothetical protein